MYICIYVSGWLSGQTKDHHKNRKNCLLTWHAGVMVGV